MKIIKKPKIPQQTCKRCGAVLEIKPKDLKWDAYSMSKTAFRCKLCKAENFVSFEK